MRRRREIEGADIVAARKQLSGGDYVCAFGCGYKGVYHEVAKHELTCPMCPQVSSDASQLSFSHCSSFIRPSQTGFHHCVYVRWYVYMFVREDSYCMV